MPHYTTGVKGYGSENLKNELENTTASKFEPNSEDVPKILDDLTAWNNVFVMGAPPPQPRAHLSEKIMRLRIIPWITPHPAKLSQKKEHGARNYSEGPKCIKPIPPLRRVVNIKAIHVVGVGKPALLTRYSLQGPPVDPSR